MREFGRCLDRDGFDALGVRASVREHQCRTRQRGRLTVNIYRLGRAAFTRSITCHHGVPARVETLRSRFGLLAAATAAEYIDEPIDCLALILIHHSSSRNAHCKDVRCQGEGRHCGRLAFASHPYPPPVASSSHQQVHDESEALEESKLWTAFYASDGFHQEKGGRRPQCQRV